MAALLAIYIITFNLFYLLYTPSVKPKDSIGISIFTDINFYDLYSLPLVVLRSCP